jgi:ABC-type multidrug transport system ATPase subunit
MEYPILVNEVWKSYGTVQAVRGLNLNVPPQSVYGFLGPNGAGKSTTIRLVLGYSAPIAEMFICLGDSWRGNVSPYFAGSVPW